ncbi:IclR family transcriptional regulator [Nocardioides yefusunii]|uniref:IclR family transcriptional regulator n=1 Tax=Nocardioides yefusunii TaxID=2500546 RepID=A0ABW1QU72_9ACTN|nr:IclR family transcriptional regulator [Nocardioides yefusunii]
MPGNLATPGSSVTQRVLALLYAFSDLHPRLTMSELALIADLPVATTHRLLAQLVEGEALVRHRDGRYSVGRRLWQLGALASTETQMREAAAPFLSDLHAATRATIHLAVREGAGALYLERIYGHTSVPVVSTVGSTLPLHSTGVGKVLLAHAPADVVAQVFARLTRHTPYTITSTARLTEQMERIRSDGWASTAEEMTLGACSLAVPVRAGTMPGAPVVAALGVVIPTLRRDRDRLVTAMHVAAAGISRQLTPRGEDALRY